MLYYYSDKNSQEFCYCTHMCKDMLWKSFITNILWSIGACVGVPASAERPDAACLSAPLIKVMRVYVIHTCPKADDCAEAVSTSLHDDCGKDFPTQKAVLNASSECIETLVTQHGKLVVHCAT